MGWIQLIVVLMAFAPVALPLGALAAPLPDGGVTASEVAAVMSGKDFPTQLSTDKDGDPLIRSTAKGLKFGVYFYGCQDKKRCDSIQFSVGFSVKDVTSAKLAQWNRTKRFGRAYLDDSFEPWVEMDMDFEHGGTTEALANDLDRWLGVISEFKKYIDQ